MKVCKAIATYSADALALEWIGNLAYGSPSDTFGIRDSIDPVYIGRRYRDQAPDRNNAVYAVRSVMESDALGTYLVSESNYAYLTENYPDTFRRLTYLNGNGLCVIGSDKLSRDVIADLERLTDYPLLDESDHSDRQFRHLNECWEDYGRRDFANALQRVAGVEDWCDLPGLSDDSDLDAAYASVRDGLNYVEYGDEPQFREDDAASLWCEANGALSP